ncbi:MAG: type VI secretion system protein TssA [Pseudomonadota bacterium]|nr:type VI secretion system protein TssA [Pseudomonadota bacterium]
MNILAERVEELLKPISETQKVGENLRDMSVGFDQMANENSGFGLFNELRRTCKSARSEERQIPEDYVGKRAEYNLIKSEIWVGIENTALDLLQNHTKDLEVVSCLIEAWTRLYGFYGVLHGFSLARQLVEVYGDQLFPLLDETDFNPKAEQITHLVGLNGKGKHGTLIKIIYLIPFLQSDAGVSISTYACQEAKTLKNEAEIEAFGLSLSSIESAFQMAESTYLPTIKNTIQNAILAYEMYLDVMENYLGKPIDGAYISGALSECLAQFNMLSQDCISEELYEESLPEEAPLEKEPKAPVQKKESIDNRKDAINQLKKISKYFKENEPHSPISYGIDRVIRWSELSLMELMQELVPDLKSQEKFTDLSGLDLKPQ